MNKEPSNTPDFPAFLHGEGGKPFHNRGNLETEYISTHTHTASPPGKMLQQPSLPLRFINQGDLLSLPQNALFTGEELR